MLDGSSWSFPIDQSLMSSSFSFCIPAICVKIDPSSAIYYRFLKFGIDLFFKANISFSFLFKLLFNIALLYNLREILKFFVNYGFISKAVYLKMKP